MGAWPRAIISGKFAVRGCGYTSVGQLAEVVPDSQLHGPAVAQFAGLLPPRQRREGRKIFFVSLFLTWLISGMMFTVLAPAAAESRT